MAPTYDYLVKMMLIGDSNVGKTSILMKFADDTYTDNNISTIGIDFKLRDIEIDGKKCRLQILDTAGQERFRTITTSHYRNAMSVMLVYDVTNVESFENIRMWIDNVNKNTPIKLPMCLVANKIDVKHRVVSTEAGKELANEIGIEYYEVSAKTGHMIDDVFHNLAAIVCAPIKIMYADQEPLIVNISGKQKQSCCTLL
jgi:small GTP-binding protein